MPHPTDPSAPNKRHRPLRILLVDDHPDTLAMMRRALRWGDYVVLTANGYGEGLRLGLTAAPDVLVSDIRLPDGSGWELLARLKEANPALVGVAASGVGSVADVVQSERAGFCVHLTKPVDLAALTAAIQQCADERPATGP